MHITVAICTWNRAELLRQTLEQFTRLGIPKGIQWELLLVLNNCNDHSEEVVDCYSDRLPIRALNEPTPGLSVARNAAVAEALGDYIIWTDDDVLVDVRWLEAYVEGFRRWPDASVFGGPILPWFTSVPPLWLQRAWQQIGSAYAMRDFGDTPFRLGLDTLPFGANFAVRGREQRLHLFDPRLGYKEDAKLAGEETAVTGAILREGKEGWWLPGARVQHYIPPERLSGQYLRTYYFGRGRQAALQSVPSRFRVLGRPAWLWMDWAWSEVRFCIRRICYPPEVWVRDLCNRSYKRGWIRGVGKTAYTPVVSVQPPDGGDARCVP